MFINCLDKSELYLVHENYSGTLHFQTFICSPLYIAPRSAPNTYTNYSCKIEYFLPINI